MDGELLVMNKLINIDKIGFQYGKSKGDYTFSLSEISISIINGEFISILGPNGSGKSTLLKILSGHLKPTTGKMELSGRSYSEFSVKEIAQKIAFVPQFNYSVFPFSVYEIVMMGRTPHLNMFGYENTDDKKAVDAALEIMEITHLKNSSIHEISGGEAQRAYIARALVQQPEIILLDEPSAHLDIKHQISIFNILKERNENENLTIVTVSHDLNLTGHYSSRIILMKNGCIYKDSSVKEILTEENIKNVFDVDSTVVYNSDSETTNVYIEPN